MASRASCVAEAMCGVRTTFSSRKSASLDLGLALEDVECRAGDAALRERGAPAPPRPLPVHQARVDEIRRDRLHQR